MTVLVLVAGLVTVTVIVLNISTLIVAVEMDATENAKLVDKGEKSPSYGAPGVLAVPPS